MTNYIGFHGTLSSKEDLTLTNTLQFFVSSPQRMVSPSHNWLLVVGELVKRGVNIVVHGPYLVSMVRPDIEGRKVGEFTRNWIMEYATGMAAILAQAGVKKIPPLVMHTGKPFEGREQETLSTLYNFLTSIDEQLKIRHLSNIFDLCVETDPCPRSMHTSLVGLYDVLTGMESGPLSSNIKICLDTEHSFASGFYNPTDRIPDEVWNRIGVVHLNAIPPEVKFGSGLDRHTSQDFASCQLKGAYCGHILKECKARKIPVIMERDREKRELIKQDMGYLEQIDALL